MNLRRPQSLDTAESVLTWAFSATEARCESTHWRSSDKEMAGKIADAMRLVHVLDVELKTVQNDRAGALQLIERLQHLRGI